jgi:RimJ/RimL family protein N-acetyltransferase
MQTLRTERLELVVLDPARDAAELHVMLGDPEVHGYSPEEATPDVASTRARLAEEFAGNGGLTWTIRLLGSSEALGTVGVFYDQGTTIRGLSWRLRRSHWGRGLMGEAARVAVAYLLEQPKIDGVEAWIDTRNVRSLGVARRAGLDEVARMPRVYADHVAQQVVMARAASPRDPSVVAVRPELGVRDVRATARLLPEGHRIRVSGPTRPPG